MMFSVSLSLLITDKSFLELVTKLFVYGIPSVNVNTPLMEMDLIVIGLVAYVSPLILKTLLSFLEDGIKLSKSGICETGSSRITSMDTLVTLTPLLYPLMVPCALQEVKTELLCCGISTKVNTCTV